MEDHEVAGILQQLRSHQPQEAWAEFLQVCSPLILQIVRFFERDPDQVSECFLFVCERLSQKRFRRLRRFKPNGPARFSTWLRAVVRNLCLDWRRKECGRHRVFESIARLSTVDREVFHRVYELGLSRNEIFPSLRTQFPNLTRAQVEEAEKRICQNLSPRQLWLLSARKLRMESIENDLSDGKDVLPQQMPDSRPDPETLAAFNERREALKRALARLSKPDRLLLRLRFEEGLTLEQVARVTGLKDPQSVDRRIRDVLERLGKEMK